MGASIINTVAVVLGGCAAIACGILYIYEWRSRKQITIPVSGLPIAANGLLNLVIGIAMVVVIFTAIPSFSSNIVSTVRLSFNLVVTIIIAVFIVGQTLYLFVSRKRYREQSMEQISDKHKGSEATGEVALPVSRRVQAPVKPDEDDKEFREKLIKEIPFDFNEIQVMGMSRPLELEKIYVPTRVYLEPLLLLATEEKKEFDPVKLLEQEEKELEGRAENALDLTEIVARERRCVLLGDPGIGKTTFLGYLALQLTARKILMPALQDVLPIYIPLNRFVSQQSSEFLTFIVNYLIERYGSSLLVAQEREATRQLVGEQEEEQEREAIKQKLEKILNGPEDQNVLLLLDGLDEVSVDDDLNAAYRVYQDVCAAISKFAQTYEKARIVVTSRQAIYDHMSTGPLKSRYKEFKTLEMAGFLQDDVQRFVRQRFEAYSESEEWQKMSSRKNITAENLLRKLQQDSRLRELSTNPLMLLIITEKYCSGTTIANRRIKLYREYVLDFLQKWDDSRGKNRAGDSGLDLKSDLLEYLGWHFHKDMQRYVSEEKIITFIKEFLGQEKYRNDAVQDSSQEDEDLCQDVSQEEENISEAKAKLLLDEIITGSGLLTKTGRFYSFRQLTFQEHFAARWMALPEHMEDQKKIDSSVPDHRNNIQLGNPWWDEVILLSKTYSTTHMDDFLKRLLAPGCNDLFKVHLLLAGRCLAVITRPITEWSSEQQRVIDTLFEELEKAEDERIGEALANALVEIADPGINKRLLGKLGVEKELLEQLEEKSQSITVRKSIAKALKLWGELSPQVTTGLVRLVIDASNGQELEIRVLVAEALGILGDCEVYSSLEQLREPDSSVSKSLVRFLKFNNLEADGAPLLEAVIKTLKRLRDSEVIPDLYNLLLPAKESSSARPLPSRRLMEQERKELARSLGVLGQFDQQYSEKVAEVLLKVVQDKAESLEVRSACIAALGRLRNRSVFGQLQTLLTDEQVEATIRGRIAIILDVLGEQSIEPPLASFLLDKKIRSDAREDLIAFLDEQNASLLVGKLVSLVEKKEIDSSVLSKLIEVLGRRGDAQVAKELEEYLRRVLSQLQDGISVSDSPVLNSTVIALGQLYDAGKCEKKDLKKLLLDILKQKSTPLGLLDHCTGVLGEVGEDADIGNEIIPILCQKIIEQLYDEQSILAEAQFKQPLDNDLPLLITLGQLCASTLPEPYLGQLRASDLREPFQLEENPLREFLLRKILLNPENYALLFAKRWQRLWPDRKNQEYPLFASLINALQKLCEPGQSNSDKKNYNETMQQLLTALFEDKPSPEGILVDGKAIRDVVLKGIIDIIEYAIAGSDTHTCKILFEKRPFLNRYNDIIDYFDTAVWNICRRRGFIVFRDGFTEEIRIEREISIPDQSADTSLVFR